MPTLNLSPRTRWRWTWILIWSLLALLLLLYTTVWPLLSIDNMGAVRSDRHLPTLMLLDEMRIRIFEALSAAWVFMFGATVGSFLNVVAYRMPRGESVIWRTSYCPHCHHKIAATDNIPIFGWLRLAGRCRVCRLPISPRYPIVELISALMFSTLAYVELFSGGANLPGHGTAQFYHGLTRTILDTRWDLAALYGFHSFLLSVLLAATLIQLDGHRLPWRLLATAMLMGFLAAAAWPPLQPVRWNGDLVTATGEDFSMMMRTSTSALGLVAGAGGGILLGATRTGRKRPAGELSAVVASSALAGLYLGWQAVVTLLTVAVLLQCAIALVTLWGKRRSGIPVLGGLWLAALLQVCLWRTFFWISDWLGMV